MIRSPISLIIKNYPTLVGSLLKIASFSLRFDKLVNTTIEATTPYWKLCHDLSYLCSLTDGFPSRVTWYPCGNCIIKSPPKRAGYLMPSSYFSVNVQTPSQSSGGGAWRKCWQRVKCNDAALFSLSISSRMVANSVIARVNFRFR